MRRGGGLHVAIASAVALACAACGNSFTTIEPNELTITMEGTITDLDTGLPVDSAFIEVRTEVAGGYAEVYSDSTGHYSFSFVYRYYPGELFCPFIVFVNHDEYLLEFFNLPCVTGVQTVDIQLERAPQAEEQ